MPALAEASHFAPQLRSIIRSRFRSLHTGENLSTGESSGCPTGRQTFIRSVFDLGPPVDLMVGKKWGFFGLICTSVSKGFESAEK